MTAVLSASVYCGAADCRQPNYILESSRSCLTAVLSTIVYCGAADCRQPDYILESSSSCLTAVLSASVYCGAQTADNLTISQSQAAVV